MLRQSRFIVKGPATHPLAPHGVPTRARDPGRDSVATRSYLAAYDNSEQLLRTGVQRTGNFPCGP